MNDPIALIEPLLRDPEVVEVLIDGWKKVYIEKQGRFIDVPTPFHSDAEVLDLINCIAEPLGKVVNESYPMLDARLQDGSLVNAVIPPISLNGPVVTLRKMVRQVITAEMLVEWNCANQAMMDFLRACVLTRVNILVAGGTNSGKQTVLNIISRYIPHDERIIVCKNDPFPLDKPRVVNLETRPANVEGRGAVTMRDLVKNAAQMRPDRIIVTEVQEAEVFELLHLMNNGYDGTMFAMHAVSPHDALARLEVMATYANASLPLASLRELMASAIDLVVYQERLRDGTRRIINISEVTGFENGVVNLQPLFEFCQTGVENGRIQGYHTATGTIPRILESLTKYGEEFASAMPVSMFTPSKP